MVVESAAGLQAARRGGQDPPEEGAQAVPSPRDPVPAEDGLCSPPCPVVPGAAAGAGSASRARAGARRDRLVQRDLPAPAGGGPPIGAAGLQHAPMDALDV